MKALVMARLDGTCFLRVPVEPPRAGETQSAYHQRLAATNKKGADLAGVIDTGQLPPEHAEFKAARRWDGATVVVDLPAAREIQRQRIEQARSDKAQELMQREALGEDVAAEKQRLQGIDARQIVDGAATVAALKAAWPSDLPRR